MYLWLDDVRRPPADWPVNVWAKTANAAITSLTDPGVCPITFMSFDHDLSDVHYKEYAEGKDASEGTGYTVALHMVKHDIWPAKGVEVHSFNSVGAEKICKLIDRYGPYKEKIWWRRRDLNGALVPPERQF